MNQAADQPTSEPLAPRASASGAWTQLASGRMARSLLGGSLAGSLVALLDALWARSAAEHQASVLGATFLACVGLVAPLALGVGAGVGAASLLLHPTEAPTPAAVLRVAQGPDERRPATASMFALVPLAVTGWTLLMAQVALVLLQSGASPRVSGIGLGLAAAGLALALGVLTLGAAQGMAALWRTAAPSPLLTGAVGMAVSAAILSHAIATGTVSGGAGGLDVFGVFKRPELDLRAPGLLALTALGAYGLPGATRRLPAWAAVALALLPIVLFGYAATRGLEERRVALTVERGAPLARVLLRPLRGVGDVDGDGVSRYFGGGDCNDADPEVNPAAADVPGNGVDEDCSGSDAVPVVLETPRVEQPKDAAAWVRAKLPKNLNVVLLSIDALRWDAVGYMGYPRRITPNLDQLAKRSVAFERAYAPASYTGKSIPPFLIGKYSSETHRGWSHFNRISKRDTTLQERLQQAGIRTLGAQGYWYFYTPTHGFDRGWDVLDSSAAPAVMQIEGDKGVTSDKLADATIRILSQPENVAGRFFFWTHYVDPHADYIRHEGFDFGSTNRDRYDGEVAFVDHHLGRVIDFIGRSSFADRTAIIVTSDHGEAFGEHGMIRHGFEVWEPLVRVPLLVYVPGVVPHRVHPRRGLVDLVPTVLDLFQLPAPSGEGSDFVSGKSWLFDIMSPPGHEPEERIVLVDMSAGPHNAERHAFYEGNLKLIASGGRPLGLYDLQADPDEKQDLLDDTALRAKVLPRYKEFRRQMRVVRVKPTPK